MRTGLVLCATVLLSAFVWAQGQQAPLSYHGWALGISLDSAKTLTRIQMGKPLVCVGEEAETVFCRTSPGPGAGARLYFGPAPRHLEDVSLALPLNRRASKDSVASWFRTQWGPPIPREFIGKRSTSGGETLGSWARDGMVFGIVGISSEDTIRQLSVSIAAADRQVRLMQERADTARRQD